MPSCDGAEVIYALRNNSTLAKKILNNIEDVGQNVRKYYQLRSPNNSKKDYYFIHRDTPNNESIIVEYGFVDSPKDDVDQIKNNYKAYAEAVIKAICDYKGIKYTKPSGSISSGTTSSDEYYTVKSDDNLWDLANKFNTSIKEIKDVNNLKSDTLKIGQKLIIPKKGDSGVKNDGLVYVVKKGDTLWDIARLYNTTVSKLKLVS